MKVGDLVKFIGTWGPTVKPGERQTGVVMKVWTNGRTRKIQSAEVLWDNGELEAMSTQKSLEVVNESR
jgi:hypothetical protein